MGMGACLRPPPLRALADISFLFLQPCQTASALPGPGAHLCGWWVWFARAASPQEREGGPQGSSFPTATCLLAIEDTAVCITWDDGALSFSWEEQFPG